MNILFLLVDSFNTEKFFGDKKTSITPNLDKLIETGTFFSEAITSAPVTLPSISSIFTSKYPFESTTERIFFKRASDYSKQTVIGQYRIQETSIQVPASDPI